MYEEEFDKLKTKMLKYIMYKKRTEKEIRQKFSNCDENMVDDAIEYLIEAGYISDKNYVERAIEEFVNINTLSLKEIKYKLMSKGVNTSLIEDYISLHYDRLLEYEAKCAQKIYYKKINSMEKQEVIVFLMKKGYKEESIRAIEGIE